MSNADPDWVTASDRMAYSSVTRSEEDERGDEHATPGENR